MRTHKETKPYGCDECEMTFVQINNLRQHQILHTREKPYKCKECNKAFNQAGHLKKLTQKRSHTHAQCVRRNLI